MDEDWLRRSARALTVVFARSCDKGLHRAMISQFLTSGLIKLVICCIIIYIMITKMISGELTTFWFLLNTLALAILVGSHKNIKHKAEKDEH